MARPFPPGPSGVLAAGFLERFAGPAAFSQVVVQPILAFLSVNVFAGGQPQTPDGLPEAIAAVAVGTFAAWAFFTLAGLFVNAVAPRPTTSRAVVVALVFALTEFIRIWTISALLPGDSIAREYGAAFLTVGSLATGVALFGMASVAVNDYRHYRESYRRYSQQLIRAQTVVVETDTSVVMVRDQLVAKVRTLLLDAVHNVLPSTSQKELAPKDIATELFRLADDIVRPLSHEVLQENLPRSLPDVQEAPPRVRFVTFANDVTTVAPFQPVAHALLTALVLGPGLLVVSSFLATLVLVACVGLVFGLAWWGRAFLATRLRRWPVLVRALVMTVLFAPPAALFMGLAFAPAVVETEQIAGLAAYGAGIGVVLGWLPAIAEGLRFSRQRFLVDLEPIEAELEWLRVRAQSQLWCHQKRLALALHSDVQSTILAAAMQLNVAISQEDPDLSEVVTKVEATIRASLALEPATQEATPIHALVNSLNHTWSTVLTLELEATPEVLAVIEGDDLALEVVTEVIKELHINAFKHGHATSCVMTLAQPTGSAVVVTACNNGVPFSEKPEGLGLGDRFMSAVSLAKSVTNTSTGACVEITIPVFDPAHRPTTLAIHQE